MIGTEGQCENHEISIIYGQRERTQLQIPEIEMRTYEYIEKGCEFDLITKLTKSQRLEKFIDT